MSYGSTFGTGICKVLLEGGLGYLVRIEVQVGEMVSKAFFNWVLTLAILSLQH